MRNRVSLLDDPNFDLFWRHYPKRRKRVDALKAWQQLAPNEALVERILRALAWQVRQDDWLQDGGRWIPLPASWIRGMRWEDEPIEVQRVSERTMKTARAIEEFLS